MHAVPFPCRPQVPPLFEKEETRERLRKLPGGATQPLTVRLLGTAAAQVLAVLRGTLCTTLCEPTAPSWEGMAW